MASTIHEQIACLDRELGMRRRVYPRWVDAKKMTQEKADREIAVMLDARSTLERLRAPDVPALVEAERVLATNPPEILSTPAWRERLQGLVDLVKALRLPSA